MASSTDFSSLPDPTYGGVSSTPGTDAKANRPLTLTHNELDKLEAAIHDPVFRQLLCDYANEMRDPDNRARYESEMVQLEAERGFKATFLHPSPGYVIKTSKAFKAEDVVYINVCSEPTVAAPKADKAVGSLAGDKFDDRIGVCWSIPYFQAHPRQELDKDTGKECTVYDVIFNPGALGIASRDYSFRRLVNDTALDAVEKAFNVKLDRSNLKFPAAPEFKGAFRPTVIREPLHPLPTPQPASVGDALPVAEGTVTSSSSSSSITSSSKPAPNYVIKYKDTPHQDLSKAAPTSQTTALTSVSDPCRPSELVVEISLPGIDSAKGIELDVLETQLTLDSNAPAKPYHLDLKLPYPVFDDMGQAKFDKATGQLRVTLPVQPPPPPPKVSHGSPVHRLISTDSGIGDELQTLSADQDEDSAGECVESSNSHINSIIDKPVVKATKGQAIEKGQFPPYSCNIYEDLMVFKLDVKNVEPETLVKEALQTEDGLGFTLCFSNVGAGLVTFNYTFQMILVTSDNFLRHDISRSEVGEDILNDTEIDVWENNIIVQFAIPTFIKCRSYKVGSSADDMTEHLLPQLKEFRLKRDQLNQTKGLKDVTNIDGKESAPKIAVTAEDDQDVEDIDSSEEKERHSSGESVDSALSMSLNAAAAGSDVITAAAADGPKGILKTKRNHPRSVRRCFSESQAEHLKWTSNHDVISGCDSVPEEEEETAVAAASSLEKKTVRFNAVVKRQVFRQNASILGQKNKNMKRAEQKMRKNERKGNNKVERRASEGDAIGMMMAADGFKISASFESSLDDEANSGISSKRSNNRAAAVAAAAAAAYDDDDDDDNEDCHQEEAEDGHDSGVASSYEDHHHHHHNLKSESASADSKVNATKVGQGKANRRRNKKKNGQQQHFHPNREQGVFNIDF